MKINARNAMLFLLPLALTLVAGCSNFTDERDGKKYKTVKIGEHVWMAENLNYAGSGADTLGRCYNDSIANCEKYGRLYNWETAMKVCPDGWFLPRNEEWDKLYRFADGDTGSASPYGSETAGKFLKAKNGWNGKEIKEEKSGNGEDKFGFAALPGGSGGNGFFDVGYYGLWWSASRAYRRGMFYNGDNADSYSMSDGGYLLSVRCVKNLSCKKIDKATQFCYYGNATEKCGGKEFDPEKQFCHSSNVVDKCGGKEFDPEKQFCSNSYTIVDKCSGEEFDPYEKYCYDGKIKNYSDCKGVNYKAETQFCAKDSTVWELCGGKKFDPEIKICSNGKITNPECNGNKFNAVDFSCLNGVLIVSNNEPFDFPERTEYEADYENLGDCNFNDIEEGCNGGCSDFVTEGGTRFDAKKAFCSNTIRYRYPRYSSSKEWNSIYKKCSGKEYKPNEQVCIKGKLFDFNCGGEKFSVNCTDYSSGNLCAQFCVNDKMYDACLVIENPNDTYSPGQYYLYNPKKEGCCGNVGVYNSLTHFCNSYGELGEACGGKEYNIGEQFCYDNKLYDGCGSNSMEYNPETHICKDGDVILVFTSGKLTDSRDSKTYKTVKIGKQTWMAENLNYEADSSLCYDNIPDNCGKYGRLYNWEMAKSVCPNGWHLPVREEWNVLEDIVGKRINGESIAGKALKSKTLWFGEDANGTNEAEFSALPGGYREGEDFKHIGKRSFWWTSENCGPSMACSRMMSSENKDVIMAFMYEWFYGSVRCVKDE